jgi:hypothetical protein
VKIEVASKRELTLLDFRLITKGSTIPIANAKERIKLTILPLLNFCLSLLHLLALLASLLLLLFLLLLLRSSSVTSY